MVVTMVTGCTLHFRIPDPALFSARADSASHHSGSSSSEVSVVRPVRVSALLVPTGKGVEQWVEFGQCLCMDWFPGNKTCKVAAGFSNGAH